MAAITLVILGLVGWCVYRFCKKKRPKGIEKGEGAQDDEDGLVAHEEVKEDEEDAEKKLEDEAKGRLKYRLEYDFTTQELKITVRAND